MFVYIACNQSRNLFFHLQINLFQLIKSLVLLIHSHKFVISPLLLQVLTIGIKYFFGLIDPLPMNALL